MSREEGKDRYTEKVVDIRISMSTSTTDEEIQSAREMLMVNQ